MASPQMSTNNTAYGATLLGVGNSVGFTLLASTDFEVQLQVCVLAGATITAGTTVTVSVYVINGYVNTTTPGIADTIATTAFAISPVASTHEYQTIKLGTGNYSIVFTNQDSSYSYTVSANVDYVTAVA